MSAPPEPSYEVRAEVADRIRKVVGYALAAGLTILLFRVLARTANGRQALADPELVALVVLGTLAVSWVAAAKRVRRRQAEAAPPADAGPTGGGDAAPPIAGTARPGPDPRGGDRQ